MARLIPWLLLAACSPDSDARIELALTRVDLGAVDCGTSKTANVEVANAGGAPLVLSVASSLAGVTLTPAAATVAPGDSVELAVTAASGGGLGTKSGFLTITSNAGDRTLPIELESTGFELALDRTTLDFGELLPRDSIERTVGVTLTGTVGATVSLDVATAGFTSNAFAEIPPGATSDFAVRFTAASDPFPTTHEAFATLVASGPLCAPAPILALAGATSTDAVLVDTTLIDFDTVRCGAFDDPGSFGLVNRSGSDTDFVAEVTDSPAWFLVEPRGGAANGRLPANETVAIPIGHLAINKVPPGTHTGVVEIRINEGTTVKHVPMQALVQRPLVRLSATAIDFGGAARGTTVTRTFRVFNEGNLVTDTMNMFSPDDELAFSPQQFTVPPNASQLVTVTFSPNATTPATFAGTVTFHPSNCEATAFVEFAGRVN